MNDKRYLFRGWDAKSKKMFPVHKVEYSQITGEAIHMFGYVEEPDDKGGWKTVYGGAVDKKFGKEKRYHFMQCTGLLAAKSYRGDSEDARLVYDGDIVYIPDWQCYSLVYWYQGAWMLKFDDCDEYLYENAGMCEIVNTVYDHPELLENRSE